MSSRLAILSSILLVLPAAAFAQSAAPLDTEEARLLDRGALEVELAGDSIADVRGPFRDEERDELHIPRVTLRAGLGSRAEVRFSLEAIHASPARSVHEPLGDGAIDERDSETGIGDARLFTKVKVFTQGDYDLRLLPDAALEFGVKMPNANDRLGTDQADVYTHGLLGADVLGARVLANLGVIILGNPGATRGQDDLFSARIGLMTPPLVVSGADARLLVEWVGRTGSRFDNDVSLGRFGVRVDHGRWYAFGAGSVAGGSGRDETGLRFGVGATFQVFD